MLTFDSIKFQIPLDVIKRVNIQDSIKTVQSKCNILLLTNKNNVPCPDIGIKNICIDNIKKVALIEVSAKILKERYFENINASNFESVLESVKKTDILYFKNSDIKNKIQFHKIDVTKNIVCTKPVQKYIQSLSYISNSDKYNFQNYHNNSITFFLNPLSKRKKLRFIFYDKFKEISKDKLVSKLIDIDKFKNVLRFEINFNNYSLIRKYFNLKKTELLDYYNILENPTNIHSLVLSELLNNNKADYSFLSPEMEDFKLTDIEKYLGRLELCKNFDFDFKKIKIFLKSKVKGNLNKYFYIYKNLCLSKPTNKEPIIKNDLINQIIKNVA